jgi:parallel beta-helix repeat protein
MMKTEVILTIILTLFLASMFSLTQKYLTVTTASTPIKVPENYPTIQEAIDAANPGDTILVAGGTYNENVIVNKDNLTLLGENPTTTFIDSSGIGEVVYITANNVYVSGFTIQHGYIGVYLDHVSNISLVRNIITDNTDYGVYFDCSTNSILIENTVCNNWMGILLWYSSGNAIYHNNFNNTIQVYAEASTNAWDGGYPIGGNYWSSYAGTDKFSGPNQNIAGSDGIGDTPYIIDSQNIDKYPLIKPYSQHDIGIINVIPSKTVIQQGEKLHINITALNYGIYTENFNITAYANKIKIQTQTLMLPSRTPITITFTWDTTNIPKGTYIIRAYATQVPGETDVVDNTYTNGFVFIDTLTMGGGWGRPPMHLLK